ncbi:MAG: hypothetical protein WDN28_18005 [Chthoniobacter sp.]
MCVWIVTTPALLGLADHAFASGTLAMVGKRVRMSMRTGRGIGTTKKAKKHERKNPFRLFCFFRGSFSSGEGAGEGREMAVGAGKNPLAWYLQPSCRPRAVRLLLSAFCFPLFSSPRGTDRKE